VVPADEWRYELYFRQRALCMNQTVLPLTGNSSERVAIALDEFMRRMGVCRATCFRWRKKGWIKTILIANRHYISAEALDEFNERAARGEFASKGSKPPGRSKKP
jgi:hypothetical protein